MAIFEVKAIKPRKLRVDAVRLELLSELRREGREVVRELKRTTANWQGIRPDFDFLISLAGGDVSLLVGPVGNMLGVQKWRWLDEGTRPHPILPRRVPLLHFRLGYNPGTRPGTLTTRRAYYIGNWWRRARAVMHPGTQPRGWSELLQRQRKKHYTERMLAAARRGLEKAKV